MTENRSAGAKWPQLYQRSDSGHGRPAGRLAVRVSDWNRPGGMNAARSARSGATGKLAALWPVQSGTVFAKTVHRPSSTRQITARKTVRYLLNSTP